MSVLTAERLKALRAQMEVNGVSTFLLTKFDPHQSEYGTDKWNYVKYFSGFTGSAGTVVVTKDKACLWTDGRYSLQSEKELAGTEYSIFNTATPKCISYEDFIKDNTPQGGKVSFDERTLSQKKAKDLLDKVADNGISFKPGMELVLNAVSDEFPEEPSVLFSHDIKYCGTDRLKKLSIVREEMAKINAGAYIISSLEDIAWLFNLRSKTSPTLSFTAYAIITTDKAVLFTSQDLSEVKDELALDNIEIYSYENVYDFIHKNIGEVKSVALSPDKTCYALYEQVENVKPSLKIVTVDIDITTKLKAVKNDTEIENFRHTCIVDGVSLVKFIRWIREASKAENVTEYEAGAKLDEIRAWEETFIRPSFSTICGYGPNGAIIHYRAAKDSSVIKPEGLLLVDSGGNYLGGTTDITRTIVLGSITDEMRDNFTRVLKCHISLAVAIFIEGTTGHYLDILARKPLWDNMLDFKHGTGHGIGFALSVHEGPHSIAARYNSVPIAPGMLISNEPGFYKNGEYGVRSENLIHARRHGESAYGKFLDFETVSLAPFDLNGVNKDLLTVEEINWLNAYHAEVYEKLSPYLDDEEKDWLRNETRAI